MVIGYYIKYDVNSDGFYTNFRIKSKKIDAGNELIKSYGEHLLELMGIKRSRDYKEPLIYFDSFKEAEAALYCILEHNKYEIFKAIDPIKFIADLFSVCYMSVDELNHRENLYDTINGIKIEDIIKYQKEIESETE